MSNSSVIKQIIISFTFVSLLIILLCIQFQSQHPEACPRMQCAPIISKCQLIDACRCEPQLNHTCYKDCSHCLGDLYPDCCSCVGICPKEDENDKSLESHVKLFEPTSEDLFNLFIEDRDSPGRWQIFTKPNPSSPPHSQTNCTMAFLDKCVDMYKCESSCMSMGATGYRWFHVGCCECVGKNCIDFGLNTIRCRNCPEESEQVIDSSIDSI